MLFLVHQQENYSACSEFSSLIRSGRETTEGGKSKEADIFWVLLRAHFNPPKSSGYKESESGSKRIYAREHKLYSLITIVKSITKLAFRAYTLSHSKTTSRTFTRNNSSGENLTLSNVCDTKFLCLTSPPKQHQSFFRNRTLRTTPETCPDPTNLVLPSHRARSH